MFEPTNVYVAFIMILVSVWGWATQACSVMKLNITAGVYHFDFIIWRTIWALVLTLLFGMGWMPPVAHDSFENISDLFHENGTVIFERMGGAALAGVTDMIFQVFLFAGIAGAGLSSTIPLQIGTTTIVGSFLTYLVESKAKLQFFIPGVLFNVIAVFFDAFTYKYLKKDQEDVHALDQLRKANDVIAKKNAVEVTTKVENAEKTPSTVDSVKAEKNDVQAPTAKFSTLKVVVICVMGALMGVPLGPGMALAGQEPNPLTPYSMTLVISVFGLIFTAPVSYLFMRFPFEGPKSSFKDWWNCSWANRWPAIWGSFTWVLGTLGYALAAPHLGYAITYVFGQSTPFVTSMYAILYWKEFQHAKCMSWTLESCMLLCFAISVGLLCFALE